MPKVRQNARGRLLRARDALLLVSAALVLVGCALGRYRGQGVSSAASVATVPAPSSSSESDSTSRSIPPGPPKVGQQAWDFRLEDLQGNSVMLSQFRGKAVMINFWASWCGPCRYEIPHIVQVYEEYRDAGLEILAINLQESRETAAQVAEQFNMRFPVLLDSKGQVAAGYYVRAIPTSIFVDAEGIIRFVHLGTVSKAALRAYVEDVIPGKPK